MTPGFSNLEPALTENETFEMLRTCVGGVFGLPPADAPDKGKDDEVLDPNQREVREEHARMDTHTHLHSRTNTHPTCIRTRTHSTHRTSSTDTVLFRCRCASSETDVSRGASSLQALYSDTQQALQQLLRSALSREPTPDGLQGIFKVRQEGRQEPLPD